MKKVSLSIAALFILVAATPLFAQENFTEGPVSRIILLHIKPGRNTDFWADVRQNLKPVYEEYKKQGVITDYAFFTKSTVEKPDDWNVGINLTYKNYGALDGLAAKTDPITLKFYGSREARTAVGMKRSENTTTVGSFLIRQVDPKPMASPTTAPKP
jgi:hypothetical protein